MKTAGDILNVLFDDHFMKKANEYSMLHNSWEDITAKNGIPAASAHSQIKNVDKGILIIEIDHPGWKQLLQTKLIQLLDDFRFRFPKLDITGISLIMGQAEPQTCKKNEIKIDRKKTEQTVSAKTDIKDIAAYINENIKDEILKEKLLKLGQNIAESESQKMI